MAPRSTEATHPTALGIHAAASAEVMLRLFNGQAHAMSCLRPALGDLALAGEAAATALRAGGRMIYAGAGSSGLMALADALELAGTFGIDPSRTPVLFAGGAASLLHMTGGVEDRLDLAAADVASIAPGPGDVVICVSASGSTPYTVEVARLARAAGARVIGIANVADAPLLRGADLPVLLDSGAEVIAGSTRMAAATVQKVALNMVSVLVGIRLGHVLDGYMVNVVADNAKLVERATRMVATVSDVDTAVARAALEQAEGQVKTAILLARGVSLPQARSLLDRAGGDLPRALLESHEFKATGPNARQ
jgi:N-acetylmuramic acid 6-phosphate etherase